MEIAYRSGRRVNQTSREATCQFFFNRRLFHSSWFFFNTWCNGPVRPHSYAEEVHECFIASRAQQNSVQCIANLSHFLCITFSKRPRRREPNGRRYFPNNRQHLGRRLFFVSPRARRQHAGKSRGAANLITFDRQRASRERPSYVSLTYRKCALGRVWEARNDENYVNLCARYSRLSASRDELSPSRSEIRWDSGSSQIAWEETRRRVVQTRKSFRQSRGIRRNWSSGVPPATVSRSALFPFARENYDLVK